MGKVGSIWTREPFQAWEGFILRVAQNHWRVTQSNFTFLSNHYGCCQDGWQGTRKQLGVQLTNCHNLLRGTVVMANFICQLGWVIWSNAGFDVVKAFFRCD